MKPTRMTLALAATLCFFTWGLAGFIPSAAADEPTPGGTPIPLNAAEHFIAAINCASGQENCVRITILMPSDNPLGPPGPTFLDTLTLELPGPVLDVAIDRFKWYPNFPSEQFAYAVTEQADRNLMVHQIDALSIDPGTALKASMRLEPDDDENELYESQGIFPLPNRSKVIALVKHMKKDPLTFLEGRVVVLDFLTMRQTVHPLGSMIPSDLAFFPPVHPADEGGGIVQSALIAATNPVDEGPHSIFKADMLDGASTVAELTKVEVGASAPPLDSSLEEFLGLFLREGAPQYKVRLNVKTAEGETNAVVYFDEQNEKARQALAVDHPKSTMIQAVKGHEPHTVITLSSEEDAPDDIEFRLRKYAGNPLAAVALLELPESAVDMDRVHNTAQLLVSQPDINQVVLVKEGKISLALGESRGNMANPTALDAVNPDHPRPIPPTAILSRTPEAGRTPLEVTFMANWLAGSDAIDEVQLSYGDGASENLDPAAHPAERKHTYTASTQLCTQPEQTGCLRRDGSTVYVAILEVSANGIESHASVRTRVLSAANHPPVIRQAVRVVRARVGHRLSMHLAIVQDLDGVEGLTARLTGIPNPDNQPTIEVRRLPGHHSHMARIRIVQWTPDASQASLEGHACTLEVTDPAGASASRNLIVVVRNSSRH